MTRDETKPIGTIGPPFDSCPTCHRTVVDDDWAVLCPDPWHREPHSPASTAATPDGA
jgi:hypothetical protein